MPRPSRCVVFFCKPDLKSDLFRAYPIFEVSLPTFSKEGNVFQLAFHTNCSSAWRRSSHDWHHESAYSAHIRKRAHLPQVQNQQLLEGGQCPSFLGCPHLLGAHSLNLTPDAGWLGSGRLRWVNVHTRGDQSSIIISRSRVLWLKAS